MYQLFNKIFITLLCKILSNLRWLVKIVKMNNTQACVDAEQYKQVHKSK